MTKTEFSGVALVTGAGGIGNIGAAVAKGFILSGLTSLVITDINPTALTSVQTTLQSLNPDATILAIPGNIASPAFLDSLFDQIKSTFGRLDYAVNCAGIAGAGKPSTELGDDEWERVNGVNYKAVWMCEKRELEMMVKQEIGSAPMDDKEAWFGGRGQRGAIVNIASQLGIVGRPTQPIYCSSKSAVIGLTRCDAIDYSPLNIRINTVCPGVIKTPMTSGEPLSQPWHMTMSMDEAVNTAPMKRMGKPEEIADVVLFLCSHRASFMQGATVVVDGGYTII